MIHFCDLVMWQYIAPLHRRALRVMDRSRVDLLFQTEELNVLNLGAKERLLRRENLWKLARYERHVARSLAATIVCGPDDEKFSRAHIVPSAEIKVLANGVDETFFDRSKFPPQPAAGSDDPLLRRHGLFARMSAASNGTSANATRSSASAFRCGAF